jgi:dephospho-CoA kinase
LDDGFARFEFPSSLYPMKRMALTGGIACGKSVVASLLIQKGLPVCEADELVHMALSNPGVVRERVAAVFGEGVVNVDGSINRRLLGQLVFSDNEKRRQLESILHPHVLNEWNTWMLHRKSEGHVLVCVIVPLLFEGGFHEGWDSIVAVVASRAMQMDRLKGRGLTEDESRARLNAQMNVEEKMKRSNYIIVNNGDMSVLESQLDKVLRKVLAQ